MWSNSAQDIKPTKWFSTQTCTSSSHKQGLPNVWIYEQSTKKCITVCMHEKMTKIRQCNNSRSEYKNDDQKNPHSQTSQLRWPGVRLQHNGYSSTAATSIRLVSRPFLSSPPATRMSPLGNRQHAQYVRSVGKSPPLFHVFLCWS